MTPSQLADATNVAASSMTHRLDRMTERGLVRRSPDPDNRTRILVELTEPGLGAVPGRGPGGQRRRVRRPRPA